MKHVAVIFAAWLSLVLAGCTSVTVEKDQEAPVQSTQAETPMAASAQTQEKAQNETKSEPDNIKVTHIHHYDAPQGEKMAAAPPQMQQAAVQPVKRPYQPPQLIKITGIGYGAESTYDAYTPGQRRLMAIRASKLDAYRSLAEQLHGIKIDSNTAISTLAAKNDSFRARINAVVRGARVVSVTPMADRNYETVLEVYVDRSFFNNAFVYTHCPGGNCGNQPIDPADLCQNGLNCQTIGE